MADDCVRLCFYGAAQTVTGSKYLVSSNGTQILVDCGLFQGRKELRLRNWEPPPFAAADLAAVVLTHAHLDHTGWLPILARHGFKGPIYCSPPTKALTELLLRDSAHLQEEEARYANKKGTSKHSPARPLYTEEEVEEVVRLLSAVEMGKVHDILPDVSIAMQPAGHILGSASLSVAVAGKRLTFSGDMGRYDAPILKDPVPVELGDVLICESTYGDRVHSELDPKLELKRVVLESVKRDGPLLIPAFAVGRTQTVLYLLAELEREGAIPAMPVFVDTPLGDKVTELYKRFTSEYDLESEALLAAGVPPLLTRNIDFCKSVSESKALNGLSGPRIIIAGSGMATGGRILHHLMRWLPDERTTVLFVGYQAEGTRGRLIQSGIKEIKMFGTYVPVLAKVETLSGFSAHGDRDEMLRWLESSSGHPSRVKIVHGEPEASRAFAEALRKRFSWRVECAEYCECLEI